MIKGDGLIIMPSGMDRNDDETEKLLSRKASVVIYGGFERL